MRLRCAAGTISAKAGLLQGARPGAAQWGVMPLPSAPPTCWHLTATQWHVMAARGMQGLRATRKAGEAADEGGAAGSRTCSRAPARR